MPHKDPEVRKAYLKQWRIDNREYLLEFDKMRWKNDPKRKESRKKYYKDDPKRYMNEARKTLYGITAEEYDAKVILQGNKCAICGKHETRINSRTQKLQTLSVDHCHKTKKNRDLLCNNCNRALGLFKDDFSIILNAAFYLQWHEENNQVEQSNREEIPNEVTV